MRAEGETGKCGRGEAAGRGSAAEALSAAHLRRMEGVRQGEHHPLLLAERLCVLVHVVM